MGALKELPFETTVQKSVSLSNSKQLVSQLQSLANNHPKGKMQYIASILWYMFET